MTAKNGKKLQLSAVLGSLISAFAMGIIRIIMDDNKMLHSEMEVIGVAAAALFGLLCTVSMFRGYLWIYNVRRTDPYAHPKRALLNLLAGLIFVAGSCTGMAIGLAQGSALWLMALSLWIIGHVAWPNPKS